MTSDQWSAIGTALPGFIIAATALMTAGLATLNHRKLINVERKVDGNLARLAEHLERARLELVALEAQRRLEVTEGQRTLAKRRRRKTARDDGNGDTQHAARTRS